MFSPYIRSERIANLEILAANALKIQSRVMEIYHLLSDFKDEQTAHFHEPLKTVLVEAGKLRNEILSSKEKTEA